MRMVPGDRLGAYELLGFLGAGGMGEVYRARDSRLNRDVAIKVLPAEVSNDADRLRRFEQEARAASALNHPNILTVYDVGTHEGMRYLVSELLEGQTLAGKIDRRPLPLRKAIDYALQLVRGLAAAHAKGIIHRDLKPENVFVTADGRVKILDFGIAKLLPAFDQRPDDAETITTPRATAPGVVVGTAGYMAPEQVRGIAADQRSDIFSFGAVFFEMLTGRMAFRRDTAADTMSAILVDDPLQASSSEHAFPPDVDRILRHCLEKNPDERYQSARDLAFHLESIPAVHDSRSAERSPRKVALWILGGLAAAALIAAAALRFAPRTAVPGGVSRFTIALPADVEFGDTLALSPDGRTVVYAARDATGRRLYKRSLDMLESMPIRGSDGGESPFFSPDGAAVGFNRDREIKWVPLEGGVAATIVERRAIDSTAATWLPDGTIVFAESGLGLQAVPVSGGPVRQLTSIDRQGGELEHLWPIAVPGSRAVSFTVHYGARDTQRVHAVSLDSGARKLLVEGNGARFLPSGHIVFQRLGSLWAARFDPAQLALTSPPAAVLDNVGIGDDWSPIVGVAESGSLAYATGGQPYLPRTLVWVDRSGREQRIDAPLRSWFWPQVSPDGKRLGFHDMNPVNMDVWIYDLEQTALIRMTFDPRQDGYPLWSPDGKQIAFWSRQDGDAANLYVRAADLTGTNRRLTTSPNYQLPFSWAAGGTLLVFQENTREAGTNIGLIAVDGKTPSKVLIETPADERAPAVSPNGRWIAYQSNLSGRDEIYVQPFPDLGGRWQVSTQGGTAPLWHPNGSELFYRLDRTIMSVAVDAGGSSFKYGSARKLFEGPYVADDLFGRNFTLAPDGRFLMMKEDPAPPPQVVVIVNWAEELRKSDARN
jgi:Tol biopolymer transport system component